MFGIASMPLGFCVRIVSVSSDRVLVSLGRVVIVASVRLAVESVRFRIASA